MLNRSELVPTLTPGMHGTTVTRIAIAWKGGLATDWITSQSRARVRGGIEETLDEGLPRAYTPNVFKTKASVFSSTSTSTTGGQPEVTAGQNQ
jgi:hypothetical protein